MTAPVRCTKFGIANILTDLVQVQVTAPQPTETYQSRFSLWPQGTEFNRSTRPRES